MSIGEIGGAPLAQDIIIVPASTTLVVLSIAPAQSAMIHEGLSSIQADPPTTSMFFPRIS